MRINSRCDVNFSTIPDGFILGSGSVRWPEQVAARQHALKNSINLLATIIRFGFFINLAAARTHCNYLPLLCFWRSLATAMAYCTYPPNTGLASREACVTARAHCNYLTLVWLLEELGCCQGTMYLPDTGLASWGAWLPSGHTVPTWHWSGFLRSLADARAQCTYLTLVWLLEELGCCQGTLYLPDTGLASWGAWLMPGHNVPTWHWSGFLRSLAAARAHWVRSGSWFSSEKQCICWKVPE